jgi:hypothetical protein
MSKKFIVLQNIAGEDFIINTDSIRLILPKTLPNGEVHIVEILLETKPDTAYPSTIRVNNTIEEIIKILGDLI